MKKLNIFRGLPGSGKTTLAKKLAQLVIEPDMFRYNENMEYIFNTEDNKACLHKTVALTEFAMRKLQLKSISVTAVHVKIAHMKKYVDLAKKYGYEVNIYECNGKWQNTHAVPKEVIDSMERDFEPGSPDNLSALDYEHISYQKTPQMEQ